MIEQRVVPIHFSDRPIEVLFRSGWFWFGLFSGCYFVSCFWLGSFGRAFPYVLLAAPSGLFHLLGISEFKNGFAVVDRVLMGRVMPLALLLSVHTVYWLAMILFLSKRRRMHRDTLLRFGWGLIIVLAANLVGCATMAYNT